MVAKTSGLTKQDYILKQLLKEEVIVHPNCRVQKILSQYLTELTEELKRIQRIEQDDDILENIIYLVELIAHMGISWLEVNKWCTDLKMKNIVCGSYHKMSVTAITARFATSVWTAATIRFITQTPRMMKNNGNALTIGFVRAFLLSLKISCVKFASKGDFDSIEIRKSLVLQDFSGFWNYSHSTVAGGLLVMS